MTSHQIFLLSPAFCGGRRAAILFSEKASFDVAQRLRSPEGVPLGDVFSFLSGLYFRGKLAYAQRFARPADRVPGFLVITPDSGLRSASESITLDGLRKFSRVPIETANMRYRRPLLRDARRLAASIGGDCSVVLLGSIATDKYVDVLLKIFGERLLFPADFVGRGDMSRGGLMLRCAGSGNELAYVSVSGAVRKGARPPRLAPLPRRWGAGERESGKEQNRGASKRSTEPRPARAWYTGRGEQGSGGAGEPGSGRAGERVSEGFRDREGLGKSKGCAR